jgi:hypothetical protein
MNPEQQDFEQLRRLMKLKRYEQPPPRYFNDFSSKVIARIEAGEGRPPFFLMTWMERIISVLGARPAYSGVFGAVACLGIIGGLVQIDSIASSGTGAGTGSLLTGESGTQPERSVGDMSTANYVYGSQSRSNGPVVQLGDSLFGGFPNINVQPARASIFPGLK